MKYLTTIFIFLSFCGLSQMRFTIKQYMLHPNVFNPGFVDPETKFSAAAIYRRQWLRQESFPEAGIVYGHYNFNKSHGLGFIASNDLINQFNQFEIGVNYVYNIPFGAHYNLGFGAKVSLNEQNLLNHNLTYFDPDEPILASNTYTHQYLNLGTGISLSSKTINVHIGLPYIFGNRFINPGKTYDIKSNHLYVSLGYKFRFSDWFILYPNMMANVVHGSQVHYCINVNALASQLFWLGLGFDSDYTASASLGLFLMTGLRLNYTYDNGFFSKHQTAGMSHEISISYGKSIKDNPFSKRKTNHFKLRRMGRSFRK